MWLSNLNLKYNFDIIFKRYFTVIKIEKYYFTLRNRNKNYFKFYFYVKPLNIGHSRTAKERPHLSGGWVMTSKVRHFKNLKLHHIKFKITGSFLLCN